MINSVVNDDSNLSIIAKEIQNRVPAQSVILTGSRATGQNISERSDYDIVIVMHILRIPIYLHKLKSLEDQLSKTTGKNITIKPLPRFKLSRSKGSLFLFKVKSEGIVIYGKDLLSVLQPGDIKDIKYDKYFSYAFSAMKLLVNNFYPGLLKKPLPTEIGKVILGDAAKAMIYCGEIYSLINGFYEPTTQGMIRRLSKIRETKDIDKSLVNNLKTALSIRKGTPVEKAPQQLWLEARKHVLDTFQFLLQRKIN